MKASGEQPTRERSEIVLLDLSRRWNGVTAIDRFNAIIHSRLSCTSRFPAQPVDQCRKIRGPSTFRMRGQTGSISFLSADERVNAFAYDPMDDLFKSANRLFWAMSLLGVQQLQELLLPAASEGADSETRGNDVTGTKIPRRLDDGLLEDTAKSLLSASHRIQQQATAAISAVFSRESPTPRIAIKTLIRAIRDSAGIVELATFHREGKVVWRELQNKLFSFFLFEHVDSMLNISLTSEPSLSQLLSHASRLGSFIAVWAAEGIGHYYSDWHFSRERLPEQLLSAVDIQDFPASNLVPLHAGLGLSLAESLLAATEKNKMDVSTAVNRMNEFCEKNVRKGFQEEVFEGLGLATRNLYPHLVPAIDLHLSRLDPGLLAYFWHGIGRAIYFAPSNFAPFRNAPWKAVQMCLREPSHSLGRRNALAGFVWALTLVNLRSPEVMATFLKHHWKDVAADDVFANGVCSALMIWHDCDPSDRDLNEFRSYRPSASPPFVTDVWRNHVTKACNDALRYHATVRDQNALGELFCYRDLPEFFNTLERSRDHLNGSMPMPDSEE